MGSTLTLLLAVVFPATAYIRLRRTPTERASSVRMRKRVAWCIGLVGLLLIPLCTYKAVRDLISP